VIGRIGCRSQARAAKAEAVALHLAAQVVGSWLDDTDSVATIQDREQGHFPRVSFVEHIVFPRTRPRFWNMYYNALL